MTPSHVLPGLIQGASLCLPNARPEKYAAVSAIQTIAINASASPGERACNSTTATHAAIKTSQPTMATPSRDVGLQCPRSQNGATSSQNSVAGAQTASTMPLGQPCAKFDDGENNRLMPISNTPATNSSHACF